LRTRSLKEARARREKGEGSAIELKTIEDREIAAAHRGAFAPLRQFLRANC